MISPGENYLWMDHPTSMAVVSPRMAIKAQALDDFIAEFTYDVTLIPEMEAPEEQN